MNHSIVQEGTGSKALAQMLLVMAFCFVTIVGQASAGDSAWELKKQQDGISVFQKQSADSSINQIRAEAVISAPVSAIADVLLDFQNRPQWDSLSRSAKLLENGNSEGTFVHIHYDMPWPVSDRDVVMRIAVRRSPESVEIHAEAVDDVAPLDGDAVRITNAWEKWTVKRLSATESHLTTTGFVDPAGPIPGWLINSMSVSQPYESVAGLRQLVLEGHTKQP